MTQKTAIFDEKDQFTLLGACESDREFVPVWLMMRCGMHPSDVSKAKEKLRFNGDFIEWKRAKNSKPRRELVPKDVKPRLEKWLERGRILTRVGYNLLVGRIGDRVGHPEYSPMTLRHTFCIQQLRYFSGMERPPPDYIGLVAVKMGCTRDVVVQNYIDLQQWMDLAGESNKGESKIGLTKGVSQHDDTSEAGQVPKRGG